MKKKSLISLCIPTNGVVEWVFPVLDSIYGQKVDNEFFEVIVTDNGNNVEFKRLILEYMKDKKNLSYYETKSLPFVNEVEAYKKATGKFIKFINHRTILLDGTLDYFIQFVNENVNCKPIVYFGNGMISGIDASREYMNFDEFVSGMSYWSSWSTGMGFWKDDFEKMDLNVGYNELFPHIPILFNERNREKYIIDNKALLRELPTGNLPKGKYDLFYAFAVEYPTLLYQLYREQAISLSTFIKVKEDNLSFIATLYLDFVIRGLYCSYDLSSYNDSIRVFYDHKNVKNRIVLMRCKRFRNRICNAIKKCLHL